MIEQRLKYGKYYATMGLEIHVALQTKEKLFSDTVNAFEMDCFSLFDAGTPGMLPVLSKEPVEMAIAFGLAVKADIKKESFFERKHYFYPDLPLGYQITQQHDPILIGGVVIIKDHLGRDKTVQIEHAHLECDAAKSIHDLHREYTAIDLARCASPLLEIVSTPCIHSPEEAKQYAKEVHSLVTFMDICDGKLEEGSFRVDASISLSTTEKLGTRVEIKNISSFAFLQAALEYEIERQKEILDAGGEIDMETRLFNEKEMATYAMRKKETVDEYRYMPDPDIMPLIFDDELVEEMKQKYIVDYFDIKSAIKSMLGTFDIVMKEEEIALLISGDLKKQWLDIIKTPLLHTERMIKILAYWIPEIITKEPSDRTIGLDELLILHASTMQAKECKDTVQKWLSSDLQMIDCMPKSISDEEVNALVKVVLIEFTQQVEKYKAGEIKMMQFIMGKVMSKLKGQAPATQVREQLEKILKDA